MSKHSKERESNGLLGVLLIIVVIAIIVAVAYGGKSFFTDKKPTNSTNEVKKNNVVMVNNTVDNNNKVNEVKENTTNEVKETSNVANEATNEVAKEEVSISDEEKALDLAKKAFGTTEGVYFRIEQPLNNGIYDISVRDSNTTSAIKWYRVNTKTGKVE